MRRARPSWPFLSATIPIAAVMLAMPLALRAPEGVVAGALRGHALGFPAELITTLFDRHPSIALGVVLIAALAATRRSLRPTVGTCVVLTLASLASSVIAFGFFYAPKAMTGIGAIALATVLGSSFASSNRARLARAIGWFALALPIGAAIVCVAICAHHDRARAATMSLGARAPLASPTTSSNALEVPWREHDRPYDALVVGDPPVLYLTNQFALWRVVDPYGSPHEPERVRDYPFAERMRLGREPGTYYVATSSRGVQLRRTGELDAEVSYFHGSASHAMSFDLDDVTGRIWVANEWRGRAVVFDARGSVRRVLTPHRGEPTFPWVTIDDAHRRVYLSSMMADGDLVVYDADSTREVARRAAVHIFQSVLDADGGTLWATRLYPGEVLEIDARTLRERAKVRLGADCRAITFDRRRQQVMAATFSSGAIFRVDPLTRRAEPFARCGVRCRSLVIDPSHDTLWTVSQDGIRRFPLERNDR